jgi:CRISPR-associated protein Csb1
MKTDQYDSLIAVTDWLQQRDQPVSITLTETLEPSGGPGTVIFPPTYAREPGKIPHPYAISTLRDDLAPEAAAAQGCEANICDLDTVGSQANRMEPGFAEPPLNSLVPQRVIRAGSTSVNLLEIGHRVADGAVRFSTLSELAAKAIAAFGNEQDASVLARLAPTSLLFGFWDSRDTMFRFPRIVASTIRATNVAVLNRSAQFNPAFDPSEIKLTEIGADQSAPTHDDKDPLSQQGLRSAPAVDSHGGVRVFGLITRRTEINLVALRTISAVKAGKVDPAETIKLRRYLLGLSLVAGRVQNAYNLRQGCLLVPSGSSATAQIVMPSGQRQAFVWEFADSYAYAQAAAKDFGVWSKDGCAESFDFEPIKVKTAIQSKSEEKAAKKAAKAGKKAGAGFNSVPVA